jgi:hypothetical protein
MGEARSISQRFPPSWRLKEVPGAYHVIDALCRPLASPSAHRYPRPHFRMVSEESL